MDAPAANPDFRAWAEAKSFHLKPRPASFGRGDVLGVPLRGHRGWLWDAAPGRIGVRFWATGKALTFKIGQAKKERGFHVETISDTGIVGWYEPAGFTDSSRYVWRPAKAAALGVRAGKGEADTGPRLNKRLRVLVAPAGLTAE